MTVKANIEPVDSHGTELHRVVLEVPTAGTFSYWPLKSKDAAHAIAAAAIAADPYHLCMMLCSKGWTKR